MPINNLRKTLEQLHGELVLVNTVDEASLSALTTIKEDIEAILDKSNDDLANFHPALTSSLNQAIENFEVSHPTITASMNNVIRTLNNLGI